MLTEDQVMKALEGVMDPELGRSVVDLGMVKDVRIEGNRVSVRIDLTVPGCPLQNEIQASAEAALRALPGVEEVRVGLGTMSDAERAQVAGKLHSTAFHVGGGLADASSPVRILVVASGKGGVGKSTVTVNLAAALHRLGKSVGVMDADIYGFSIPRMLGVDNQPVVLDEKTILPSQAQGLKVVSIGSFVDEVTPIIWRGPMLLKVLDQFIDDVQWGEPDYLVIDSPPGTGDIAISIFQRLPRAQLVIVTTPQAAAARVAARVAQMAMKTNQKLIGIIENMSYYQCPQCGHREAIFGQGGGSELARQFSVPLLGQIPIGGEIREQGDLGRPSVLADPESAAGKAFLEIARRIDAEWQEAPAGG